MGHDQNRANNKAQLLSEALTACKQSFVAAGVFSGVANLLMLVPAFFMLNVYDKAVGHNSVSTLWVLSGITAFMFVMLGAMEALRSRVLVAISSRLDQLIAPELYRLTFANAVLVGGHRAGNQPLNDINSLRQFLTGQAIFAVFDTPWLPIYLLILFLFHPVLGWMGVIAAITFLAIAVLNQRQVKPGLERANHLARENGGATQRALRNAEVAMAMGMVPELEGRWRAKQDEVLALQEEASNRAGAFNAIVKTLRLAVQSAAIAAGAYLVLNQEISPGMIIAGSILIGRALQPVETAVGAWRGFVDAKGQYDRLNEMLCKAPEKVERMDLPPVQGALRASNAHIVPPGSSKVTLANVGFDIPAGSVCMVLGPSGAGKSTLVRGILGLWPTAGGDIRLDGVATSLFDRTQLGSQLGYLPQDIELLEGSIAANIARFGDLDAESVVTAAQDAGVHEFILSLENGYETLVGGKGGLLSPGQSQRLALARALYKRPKLVVLDEPNSNLDEAGDAALNQAITILKSSGSTVVMVSHRPSALPLADYLLCISGGSVADFGPASEVLGRLSQQSQSAGHALPSGASSAAPSASFRAVSWQKPE